MSTESSARVDVPSTVGPDAIDFERYGDFLVGTGSAFVIYDRRNDDAWIRADATWSLEDMR